MRYRATNWKPWFDLLVLCVVLVAVNVLAGFFHVRFDLTQERAFTLSEGTRSILADLESPVQVRLYAGSSDRSMPPFLSNYAARVQELLEEMAVVSRGKLEVQRLNPAPDSESEESARIDGLQPQPLPHGETLTLGVSVTMLDTKVVIPFLAPDRERLLEYDLARAFSQVSREEKPVVGIMSPLPVLGAPLALMMGEGQGRQPWALADELRHDFDLRQVALGAPSIPQEISTLLVIHPKEISPETEFVLDQFLLRGGRLIVFLDPYCIFDGGFGPTPQATRSTLPNLLPAWGLEFDETQAVADLDFEGETREGRAPALLDLTRAALNPDDILTSDADSLLLAFAGAFAGDAGEGISSEILIHASRNSQLVDPSLARLSPGDVIRDFHPSGHEMPLALRLTGSFRTAFPDGRPAAKEASEFLTESTSESTVVLVGDVDMLHDPLAVTEVRGLFPGGRVLAPVNGNLAFAQAAVEQLAGNESLIAVRSRASRNRPFTRLRALLAEAEQKFQATIRGLEESLEETRSRLAQLQQGKKEGQKFILTAEQQREIEAFRAKEADVSRQLKETRRQLRSEIHALEVRLKWLNIAAVPALVVAVGIGVGIWKKRRSCAQ